MPHGGGHVGGFSGGGGGFSGGGWGGGGFGGHHHRHHHGIGHRHHHHHYTFGGPSWYYWWRPAYYYSGSPGYAHRRVYNCACLGFWLIIAIMVVIIVLPAAIGTSSSSRSYSYGPGDTRIVSGINPSFCSGAQLTDRSSYTTTLYSLTKRPPLTSRSNFTVPTVPTQTVDGSHGYLYWFYYMHQKSQFTVTMCVRTIGSTVSLLLIRGNSNYNSWVKDGSERHVTSTTYVSTACSTSGPSASKSYMVPSGRDDDWYIIVYNRNSRAVQVDISIAVNRTEYTIIPEDIRNQCTTDNSLSCRVPRSNGDTYLVKVDPGISPNYEDNVDVSVDCHVNGGVVAATVVVPIVFFVAVITALGVLFCVFMRRKNKKTTATAHMSDETAHINSLSSDPSVSATAPQQPPVNPMAPPPYVSVAGDHPPAYGSADKQGF